MHSRKCNFLHKPLVRLHYFYCHFWNSPNLSWVWVNDNIFYCGIVACRVVENGKKKLAPKGRDTCAPSLLRPTSAPRLLFYLQIAGSTNFKWFWSSKWMKTFIFNQIDKKIVNINVFDAINGWERLKAMPQAKSIRKLTKNFFDTSIRVPVNFPKKKKKKNGPRTPIRKWI